MGKREEKRIGLTHVKEEDACCLYRTTCTRSHRHFSLSFFRSVNAHGMSNPNDIIPSNDRIRLLLIGWWNSYRMRRYVMLCGAYVISTTYTLQHNPDVILFTGSAPFSLLYTPTS